MDEEIFYDQKLDWLNQNKFVRLRKKEDKVILTYKHNSKQKVDSAQEIEFEILNINAARLFLEALDLIRYRQIQKYRHTFKLDGVTFDIDTWPKIPVYVELEGDSVEEIKVVAEKVGFDWEKRFDKDARYVFKHYGYDFDKLKNVTFDKFE
ncbi:MAG: CYTH domain-containing protein [Candidatus Paceibacterota bacterium]